MSQSTMAGTRSQFGDRSRETRVVGDEQVNDLLDALDDEDSRAVLEATSDESLSANEISEVCDIPLSTTYRKLETLTELGLLEEGTRVRRSGKHASEYTRRVDDITVSVSAENGFELDVTRRDPGERAASSPVLGGQ